MTQKEKNALNVVQLINDNEDLLIESGSFDLDDISAGLALIRKAILPLDIEEQNKVKLVVTNSLIGLLAMADAPDECLDSCQNVLQTVSNVLE